MVPTYSSSLLAIYSTQTVMSVSNHRQQEQLWCIPRYLAGTHLVFVGEQLYLLHTFDVAQTQDKLLGIVTIPAFSTYIRLPLLRSASSLP